MTSKQFKRQIEDFTCEHCGQKVIGNGYTNHCYKCLWSKHVDVYPGDRMSNCAGLMKPIEVRADGDSYILVHRCIVCGYTKKNKMTSEDSMDKAIEIAKEIANR